MSDSDSDDEAPGATLDSIASSHHITLSIKSTYTQWNAVEAFRELVQNWREGCLSNVMGGAED